MEPIRVLHVVVQTDQGGIENFIMNLYRNIDKDKIQFDFLKHRYTTGYFDEEIKRFGGRIYSVLPFNTKNLLTKRYQKSLNDFFKNNTYNIVHSHVNTWSGYVLEAAFNNKVPVRISHAHSSYRKGNDLSKIKSIIKTIPKKKIPKYATVCFACSEAAGKWLYNNQSYTVINNAIDTEKFCFNEKTRKKIRNQMNILEDQLVLGHVGSFSYPKNHEFLIDIFNEVHKEKPDSILLLVGDGELKKSIEKKVNLLDLQDSVIFTGVRSDVSDLMQAMDAFVFPSHFEGLPVTLIEAQASGLPCFTSSNVTNEAKITEQVEFIDLEQTARDWTKKILFVEKSYFRTDLNENIYKNKYDVKENAKQLERFYLQRR